MALTEQHLDELIENGFVIVPNYFPEPERRELAAAQRRVLKTWDEVKHDPPSGRSYFSGYPVPEVLLNKTPLNADWAQFARQFFQTEHVFAGIGPVFARYPGFVGDTGEPHQDNGNNSLLPPSGSPRRFARLSFWVHLEDVGEDQAPLQLIPSRYGNDLSKAQKLVCAGGTLCVFTTYVWHAAGNYTRGDGQRFTWGGAFGRAENLWEGLNPYLHLGMDAVFQKLVSSLNADERTLLRFPPPGHPYYTAQALAALENQYPGWNAQGEYTSR